ncbi:uncharacterized protein [Aegilops tauschii subsp. strangulata]|uniref:uncharacterized protein n=1 Tax=Aegilops tauschii subsp. strangulata TaxID=200361 RepID=UPI003CC8AD1E
MAFSDEYKDVEAHGNTKLHVIHTNEKKQMSISLAQYERHLRLQRHKIKLALVQLSVGKTQPVLLFQLSATERCTVFDNFLADPWYTFAGFSIDGDKTRLERVNLEVANFVDIQKEWRVPEEHEEEDHDDEHRRWATLPLSMRHIEYATKDTYAAYKIWNCITLTQDGLRCAKLEKEEPPKKRARSSWGWGDPNW